MEKLLYNLVIHPDFPDSIQKIAGSLSTNVNKISTITSEEEKIIEKNLIQEALTEINQQPEIYKAIAQREYEERRQSWNLSQKSQEILQDIAQSPLWSKINFSMMNKFMGNMPENLETEMNFDLGNPTCNINLIPTVNVDERLKDYCNSKLQQKEITSISEASAEQVDIRTNTVTRT